MKHHIQRAISLFLLLAVLLEANMPINHLPDNALKLYEGKYFDIKYPIDFKAYPPNRKANLSDEATFVSPDGEVEFYIYSPQWNGKPRYLKRRANEIVEANKRKTVSSQDKIGYTHLTWRTYRDKHGRYNRAFLVRKTNCPSSNTEDDCSNITVFGIKFKNKASYKRYKKEYIRFKKSLEQYAD